MTHLRVSRELGQPSLGAVAVVTTEQPREDAMTENLPDPLVDPQPQQAPITPSSPDQGLADSTATTSSNAKAKAPRRPLSVLGTITIAAVTAAIVGIVAGLAGYLVGQKADDTTSGATANVVSLPQASEGGTGASGQLASVNSIVRAELPSVVSILAEGATQSGSGSGFIVRSDGYLLTNNHVVALAGDKGKLTVVFNDGTRVPGTVVGTNPAYDIAVVKVDRKDLPAMQLGDSTKVLVGDPAIAIGAPLGLDGTVTLGIISALDRPVTAGDTTDTSFINAIQTDAAINPGNSGGPLIDQAGHVIGINSAIASMGTASGEAGSIGLGFAIPINTAKRIAEELIATGHSQTPIIGVSLDSRYDKGGAKVQTVTAGGPSAAAGVQPGDIITKLNERTINDATELVVAIRSYAPGDHVKLTITRGGADLTADVTLGTEK